MRIFLIESEELNHCPNCSGILCGYDFKIRYLIRDTGEKETYKLRRLKCKGCQRLHTEIPDIMQPYKHHESKVIEAELSGTGTSCPADDSTIRVWRKQFAQNINKISGVLKSFWIRMHKVPYPLLENSLLHHFINKGPGWLTLVTQLCIKDGFGLPT